MAKATRRQYPTDGILKELRAFGLAYPGAHTKSPWPGHLDLAVNDKTFAYLSLPGEPLAISCKLPRSSAMALMLPFCKPTAYGLGKSGWVSATFEDANVDVGMLKAWIDESYRAQAPKRLVASLPASSPPPAKAPAKRAVAKRPAKPGAAKQPVRRAAPRAR
jgi:predicted DNA-binding protein (MmcQ/YjbR family)